MFSQFGALLSGNPRKAVWIELACTSAPAINGPAEVEWRSWSDGAVGPSTTTLFRNALGGTFPKYTSEKRYVFTVPGGPA